MDKVGSARAFELNYGGRLDTSRYKAKWDGDGRRSKIYKMWLAFEISHTDDTGWHCMVG